MHKLPTTELVIAIGMRTEEAKTEVEAQPVTTEAKVSNCSIDLKPKKLFYVSYSSINFDLFLQWNNFLYHLYFSI